MMLARHCQQFIPEILMAVHTENNSIFISENWKLTLRFWHTIISLDVNFENCGPNSCISM